MEHIASVTRLYEFFRLIKVVFHVACSDHFSICVLLLTLRTHMIRDDAQLKAAQFTLALF